MGVDSLLSDIGIDIRLQRTQLIAEMNSFLKSAQKGGGAATSPGGKSADGAGGGGAGVDSSLISAMSVFQIADTFPVMDKITRTPRDILENIFAIQGIECDPSLFEDCVVKLVKLLRDRCALIDNTGFEYDLFISYRVDADKIVAELLYHQLKAAGLNPFLDKICLPAGEGWKSNFLKGLSKSKVFVTLISVAGLAKAKDLYIDHTGDNVLLELQMALDINQQRQIAGHPQFIVPVHVSELQAGSLKKFMYSGFSLQQYSDSISAKENPEEIEKKKKAEEDAVKNWVGNSTGAGGGKCQKKTGCRE